MGGSRPSPRRRDSGCKVMATERVGIVGAGHAGFQLGASLRQGGFDGAIVLLSDERVLPYQRPPLSKDYLDGKIGLDLLLMRPEAFYRDHRIDYLPGAPAAEIDRAARQLRLASGDRKSTRLNSSHTVISYAVFCLKKKNIKTKSHRLTHSST